MSLDGFSPGSWTYTCNFSSGGNRSYAVSIVAASQVIDNGHTCYDGQAGEKVWVTISSASSNVLTVAGAPPSPPPPPVTYTEIAGGVAHTWTNPANAGGSQGPSVGNQQSVQVSCVTQGFPVENGNTNWYLLASSPWNGQYWVSADAFYNGYPSGGTLVGTPYVDPAVRAC
jgi:hypothetical protein